MIISIIVNFGVGQWIGKKRNSKFPLIIGIVFNLIILGYYKYIDFFINTINVIFNSNIQEQQLALPIGISFFTFQSLSYLVDVYRGNESVQTNFISLGLYIALFPQLIAGPIVRYKEISDQINYRVVTIIKVSNGIKRFILGLAKKVIIADQMGYVADMIFSSTTTDLSSGMAWVGIIAYTLQIYFDFSGYSDMAIGLGKMFGFDFPENFDSPYISQSVTEFWRRWHMTLGRWFRDYVYIPLGGNRTSTLKLLRNISIVWMLTGFWHGASWTFIAWGAYYGILLGIEKYWLSNLLEKTWRPIRHVYLLLIVSIGWVFFRADDFNYAFSYLKVMFGMEGSFSMYGINYFLLNHGMFFILGIIFSMPVKHTLSFLPNNYFTRIASLFLYLTLFIVTIIIVMNDTYSPFLYFRF
jgi:alginate O-acetyltransferase complex protein AlgI